MASETRVIAAKRQAMIADALAAARQRSQLGAFIGYLELYCDDQGCNVREVDVKLKEYEDETPSRFLCPSCRAPLKLHAVLTLDERRRADEAEARANVNARLYRRRNPGAMGVPLSALLDDRLPEAGT
jgi:hypothetical protein